MTFICLTVILLFFFEQAPSQEKEDQVQPSRAPFPISINGVGIVEPKSGNIYIGIPFNRVVKSLNVSVNDQVKKGDVLFQLEHQDLLADLQVKQAEYKRSLANLSRLQALPRKEDLIIREETLKQAQSELDESKAQYEMVTHLSNPNAISKEEQDRRLYKYRIAEANLKVQQAQLEKIKSGTWQPELQVAIEEVKQSEAAVKAIESEIDKTFIKSPIDGTILQIKIHEGETASSDPSKTLMIIGNMNELYLRVSINQFDIPYLKTYNRAIAFRQGDRSIEFPLEFIHVEPFMVPKKYLTNEASEKVDTQTLEILYRIVKKDPLLFIGEQMDVFLNVEKK